MTTKTKEIPAWVKDLVEKKTPAPVEIKEVEDRRPQTYSILLEAELDRYFKDIKISPKNLSPELSVIVDGFEFGFRENLTMRELELMLITHWENNEPKGRVIKNKNEFEDAVFWFMTDLRWGKTYPRKKR